MDKALSSTDERLVDVLENRALWGQAQPRVERQLGGQSNSSYLLRVSEQSFVVRLNAELTQLGVNRDLEYQVLDLLQTTDFAVEVFHAEPGLLITHYYDTLEPIDQNILHFGVASLLRRLHDQSWRQKLMLAPETWTPLKTIQDLVKQVAKQKFSTKLMLKLDQKLQYFTDQHWPTNLISLCHGDLNPGNILYTETGIILIDWEYARLGHPAFDLASYCETHELDLAQRRKLLKDYGGTVTETQLYQYAEAFRSIEVLWWQARSPATELAFEKALDRFAEH